MFIEVHKISGLVHKEIAQGMSQRILFERVKGKPKWLTNDEAIDRLRDMIREGTTDVKVG